MDSKSCGWLGELLRLWGCTMWRFALIFVSILTLSGCSTTYGELGMDGGVAAAPITSDTYRISSRGNGFTDATVIQDFALLKAAEVTLAAGKTHFVIVDNADASTRSTGQTAGTFNNFGGFATYNPGTTYDIVEPGKDLLIRVLTVGPGETAPQGSFPAQEVYDSINPRVERAEA